MPFVRVFLPALAALWWFVPAAQAESVYRCRGADGHVAYQDRPCAASQQQAEVEIAAAPPTASSPDYGVASKPRAAASARGQRVSRRAGDRAEPSSWQCRAANGEVFYRHASCPKSLAQPGSTTARRGGDKKPVAVTAVPLPRSEACRRMAAERGRSGKARDERASTYERNLGRDPCRRP